MVSKVLRLYKYLNLFNNFRNSKNFIFNNITIRRIFKKVQVRLISISPGLFQSIAKRRYQFCIWTTFITVKQIPVQCYTRLFINKPLKRNLEYPLFKYLSVLLYIFIHRTSG